MGSPIPGAIPCEYYLAMDVSGDARGTRHQLAPVVNNAGQGSQMKDERAWSADEIRRIGYRAIDLIVDHLTTLPNGPVFQPFPPERAAKYLGARAPEHGETADDILATFEEEILPYPFGNGHPRFYGWVNSPPAVMGVIAESLAAAMNPSCAGGNHAAIYVERQVINWFKQITGFPAAAWVCWSVAARWPH